MELWDDSGILRFCDSEFCLICWLGCSTFVFVVFPGCWMTLSFSLSDRTSLGIMTWSLLVSMSSWLNITSHLTVTDHLLGQYIQKPLDLEL